MFLEVLAGFCGIWRSYRFSRNIEVFYKCQQDFTGFQRSQEDLGSQSDFRGPSRDFRGLSRIQQNCFVVEVFYNGKQDLRGLRICRILAGSQRILEVLARLWRFYNFFQQDLVGSQRSLRGLQWNFRGLWKILEDLVGFQMSWLDFVGSQRSQQDYYLRVLSRIKEVLTGFSSLRRIQLVLTGFLERSQWDFGGQQNFRGPSKI